MSNTKDKVKVLVTIEAPNLGGKISFDYKYRGIGEGHAAGLLLQAYINAATDFMAEHNPECQNCELYQIHKEVVASVHSALNALKMKI